MKKITALLGITSLLVLGFSSATAQEIKLCSTTEMMNKYFDEHPSLKQAYLAEERIRDQKDQVAFANGYKEGDGKSMVPIYIIPVVFHILHVGGPENISDAQIVDEIRILNEDFRRLNSDTSAIVPTFKPIAADCEIEFRLAQKDPLGNCTNGIDRIYSSETNVGDDGSKLNDWPRNKYLNVWVVKNITSGAAGYAYLPGTTSAANDGIVILSNYIGAIGTGSTTRSRALTHEIGHYLNLLHTWGNGTVAADCSGSDFVSDTPATMGWQTCNLSGATCGSTLDNVQNFMEYAYCSKMFTTGQKNSMRTALTSSIASRNNLWTTTNLTATGVSIPAVLCLADFKSSDLSNVVCQGDSLAFTDLSWNGNPTGWAWTFAGGTPATSIDSVPMITYNTPGVYNVSLTVSNSSGSVSATKTSYVTVYPNTATYTSSFYSESFEGSGIPNVDWNVYNATPGTNTWTQTSTAAATGAKSVCIINASTYDGNVDELISPSINMTMIPGVPSLTYKVAYAQKTATSADKLQVYVRTGCSSPWSLRQTISGTTLSTAGVVSTSFVPTASQWVTKTINLTSVTTATSLFVKFKFISNAGNNIYLDDINILSNVGVDELSNNINFNVYPNPAEDNTVIAFNLIEKNQADIKIYDVVGKEVSLIFTGNLSAGEHQYSISGNTKLAAGAYFVKLTVGGESFAKKLIVK